MGPAVAIALRECREKGVVTAAPPTAPVPTKPAQVQPGVRTRCRPRKSKELVNERLDPGGQGRVGVSSHRGELPGGAVRRAMIAAHLGLRRTQPPWTAEEVGDESGQKEK
jgi:hypothetical protein